MPNLRAAALSLVASLILLPAAGRAHEPLLTPAQSEAYGAAFRAIADDDWDAARRHAATVSQPLAEKLMRWQDYIRPGSGASFADIARFLAENPVWPDRALLRRRAEEAMRPETPERAVRAWFAAHPPLSVNGRIRFAEALFAAGRRAAGVAQIRAAWASGAFGRRQEHDFVRAYRKLLRPRDHLARLERLLWAGREHAARHVMRRVDAGHRALAEARLRLRAMSWGVDAAIRAVPADLRDDPGLAFERLRWRRRKGRDADARELLRSAPATLAQPHRWWAERAIQVRRALSAGYVSEAYRLARSHRQTSGLGYAEAEWLAGWIALRFLADHETAYAHFRNMAARVSSPVSRARAGYWMGRAAEAMGRSADAAAAYRGAARYGTTFYGQLAAARLDLAHLPPPPPPPQPSAASRAAFEASELVRAARLLDALDAPALEDPILRQLGARAGSAAERGLIAALAIELDRPHIAVELARGARRRGESLGRLGYPLPPLATGGGGLEPALVLAVIRQESGFDGTAVSNKGARGLMQLSPATARIVARAIEVHYAAAKLTDEPAYNLRLGRAHLADLLDAFDGSYVLALAAYNAGTARLRRWLRANGDPREPAVDTIDWIELIPFGETRDYVQRVMENLEVYRWRLGSGPPAAAIEVDLERGRPGPAAPTACHKGRDGAACRLTRAAKEEG